MLAMCSNKTWFYKLTATLTIIGGLNWGLLGFFDFDLVQALFSSMEMLPTIVHDLRLFNLQRLDWSWSYFR